MIIEQINKVSKEEGVNVNIAKAILEEITAYNHLTLSIVELANKATCSQPTVTRFVQYIGMKSYKTLIKLINQETKTYFSTPQLTNFDMQAEIDKIVFDVKNTLSNINEEQLNTIAKAIVQAKKINIVWMGGNEALKSEIEHKLSQIGKHVMIGHYWHQQLINVHYMTEQDLLIVLSYSGDKYETVKVAQAAKDKKIPMLVITGDFDSKIRHLGDYKVINYSTDAKYRAFSITSKVVSMAIFDLIFQKMLTYGVVTPEIIKAWKWEN